MFFYFEYLVSRELCGKEMICLSVIKLFLRKHIIDFIITSNFSNIIYMLVLYACHLRNVAFSSTYLS